VALVGGEAAAWRVVPEAPAPIAEAPSPEPPAVVPSPEPPPTEPLPTVAGPGL
jgi:hypothetical protein